MRPADTATPAAVQAASAGTGASSHNRLSITAISSRLRNCQLRAVRIKLRTSSRSTHSASACVSIAGDVSGFIAREFRACDAAAPPFVRPCLHGWRLASDSRRT